MATIRRRKSAWQVQIRRLSHQVSRTFRLRADAELWARQLEAELDRGGLPVDSRRLRTLTLADLLRRYEAEIVPRKRGADREVYMLRVILRHPVARASLHLLTTAEIAKYRDDRLALVKGDTVRRELARRVRGDLRGRILQTRSTAMVGKSGAYWNLLYFEPAWDKSKVCA
jgi:hypothetical protein